MDVEEDSKEEDSKDEENEKAIGEFKAEFKHETKDVSNLISDKDFISHMDVPMYIEYHLNS